MEFGEKRDLFDQMMDDLVKIAERDGVITNEEAKVLKKIRISVEEFQSAVDKAQEDGIITDKERLLLQNIEDQLLQKTFSMIERDEQLDEDTKEIIESLFNVLMSTL